MKLAYDSQREPTHESSTRAYKKDVNPSRLPNTTPAQNA